MLHKDGAYVPGSQLRLQTNKGKTGKGANEERQKKQGQKGRQKKKAEYQGKIATQNWDGELTLRFEKAREEGNSLFQPFVLPKPYTSAKDIFCLRETRTVNGYRKISLFNHEIVVPNVPLREEVEVHLVPDIARDVLEIRIWWNNRMVHSVAYPLKDFP